MSRDAAPVELPWRAGDHGGVLPPLARGLPGLGSLLGFLRDPVRHAAQQYLQYGPVFRLRLGPKTAVVLAGAEANRWIMYHGRQHLATEGIYDVVLDLMGGGSTGHPVNLDGAPHAALRKRLGRSMSRALLLQNIGQATELAEREFARAATSGVVDVVAMAKRLVYCQLGQIMAGEAPMELLDDYKIIVDAIINGVRFPITRRLRRPSILRAAARVRAFHERLLDGGERGNRYVDDVIRAVAEGQILRADAGTALLGPFIAGIDTLAHSLSFAIFALASRPELQERLREQADALFSGPAIDAAALRQCAFLQAFSNEVLRCYPVSPGVIRYVSAPFELGGHQLRVDDDVIVVHAASHFLEAHFADAEVFDPARFLGSTRDRALGAYAPYGVGEHVCLGAALADLLQFLDVAVLVHRYRVSLQPSSYRLRVKWTPVAQPVGLQVRLQARGRG